MLQRFLFFAVMVVVFSLAFRGCGPSIESHVSMQVEKVAGRPYLILQSYSSATENTPYSLSVYTPAGKSLDEWASVTPDRSGLSLGMFVTRVPRMTKNDPKSLIARLFPGWWLDENYDIPRDERLGLFYRDDNREAAARALLLDPAERPLAGSSINMDVRWPPETAADLHGATYAFGVKVDPAVQAPAEGNRIEGVLKAVKFDGFTWREVPGDGPKVSIKGPGFTLRAVEFGGKLRIFWRDMETDELLGEMMEGPRYVSSGTLTMATFDGAKFNSTIQTIDSLPRGSSNIWSAGDQIKVLVQARLKREDAISTNGALEIYGIRPTEKDAVITAQLLETAAPEQPKSNLLPFISAEHITWEGEEYILRSNWQMFEVWKKPADGTWTLAMRNPRGLPRHNLETVLISTMLICLGMMAFGATLAYRRRKYVLAVNGRIQARDVYASLSLRMGAYALDICIIFALAILIGQIARLPYISPMAMLPADVSRMPNGTLFIVYIVYMAGMEWLLGATAGKFVMGLRVVMDTGQKCSLWGAVVRNLFGFYERLPLVAMFVPVPMIILTPRRQRLGDLLGRTFVVHKSALEAFKIQRARELAKSQQQQNADATPTETSSQSAGEKTDQRP
jgi:uncharacterized RDD family membrane protein YckC